MNEEMIYTESGEASTPAIEQSAENLVEQIEQPASETIAADKPKKNDDPGRSFRELREKAERLERERNDYALRLAQSEAVKQQINAPAPEEDINFGDDDLVEGKVLKKVVKKIEQRLERQYQQQREVTTEMMLKSRFNDFDSVVNERTIAQLRDKYPEVAQSLNTQPDPYAKLSAAYTLIKDLNLVDKSPDRYEEDKEVIQRNLKQPKSASSMGTQTGTTPLSQANDYARRYSASMADKIRAEVESIIQR